MRVDRHDHARQPVAHQPLTLFFVVPQTAVGADHRMDAPFRGVPRHRPQIPVHHRLPAHKQQIPDMILHRDIDHLPRLRQYVTLWLRSSRQTSTTRTRPKTAIRVANVRDRKLRDTPARRGSRPPRINFSAPSWDAPPASKNPLPPAPLPASPLQLFQHCSFQIDIVAANKPTGKHSFAPDPNASALLPIFRPPPPLKLDLLIARNWLIYLLPIDWPMIWGITPAPGRSFPRPRGEISAVPSVPQTLTLSPLAFKVSALNSRCPMV